MVTKKVEEVATTWAILNDFVIRPYKEWEVCGQPVVSVIAFDVHGKGHTMTYDLDGNEVLVK